MVNGQKDALEPGERAVVKRVLAVLLEDTGSILSNNSGSQWSVTPVLRTRCCRLASMGTTHTSRSNPYTQTKHTRKINLKI